MSIQPIPFNRPRVAPNQIEYLTKSIRSGRIAGDGPFTKKVSEYLSNIHENSAVLLTTSCTSALEMSAILLEIQEGDEVIVPSFTFVSSANAFVLSGAKIVFVDIEPTTWNIDVEEVSKSIGPRTKAIVAVNYGGFPSVTPDLINLAQNFGIPIIEDNAHGLFSKDQGKPLGTLSSISTLSFHETKNVSCGEGGAIVVNDPKFVARAEVIREKGTNRSAFFRGQIDKYTWVDKGSSFLLSDVNAAMLLAQLEDSKTIQENRRFAFKSYSDELRTWAHNYDVRLPVRLGSEESAFHMFPILMPDLETRTRLINHGRKHEVGLVFHYVPLHSSPAGRRFGRTISSCQVTNDISERLVRLPLYSDIGTKDAERVIEVIKKFHS